MKRVILTAVVASAFAAPAWADVTMKSTIAGKGLGMNASAATTTYIKGLKMRSDQVSGDTTRTTIFDVENQKMYIFDSKKKEADVWDMADFGRQIGSSVDTSGMTASFKPNGQTKTIAGKTATGYDMNITMPARMGDAKNGMQMTVTLTGPSWIVKGAPGTEDFQRFYKAAADKGFVFTNPSVAKSQAGQAKATTEMYRAMAEAGGVPYETVMDIKMSGEGPMAGIMAKMGNISSTTTVQSIDTGAVGDEFFAPPAGYKLNVKK